MESLSIVLYLNTVVYALYIVNLLVGGGFDHTSFSFLVVLYHIIREMNQKTYNNYGSFCEHQYKANIFAFL